MYKSIKGQNLITVILSKPDDPYRMRMFFDPYTKNITTSYQGEVVAIIPGYDPYETPQIMVRPQRMTHGFNIQYSFREGKKTNDSVDFYIQDQYFQEIPIKTYYCFQCQAPQLYYSDNKVVKYNDKLDVKTGDSYHCDNPNCNQSFTYLGMVKLIEYGVI